MPERGIIHLALPVHQRFQRTALAKIGGIPRAGFRSAKGQNRRQSPPLLTLRFFDLLEDFDELESAVRFELVVGMARPVNLAAPGGNTLHGIERRGRGLATFSRPPDRRDIILKISIGVGLPNGFKFAKRRHSWRDSQSGG